MLVQIAPSNARPRDPEDPIQNKPVVPWSTTAPGPTLDHERLKAGPFFVAHQSAYQNGLRKSHFESDPTAVGNPLCQHILECIEIIGESSKGRSPRASATQRCYTMGDHNQLEIARVPPKTGSRIVTQSCYTSYPEACLFEEVILPSPPHMPRPPLAPATAVRL